MKLNFNRIGYPLVKLQLDQIVDSTLQMRNLNRDFQFKYADKFKNNSKFKTMVELEQFVDDQFDKMNKLRHLEASEKGNLSKFVENLDRKIRTNELEFLDKRNFSDNKKAKIIKNLHHFNQMMQSYPEFLNIIKPLISLAYKKNNRPARILELASGSGDFTITIAKIAEDEGLMVEITGSDILPRHVKDGNLKALDQNVNAKFIEANAFDLADFEENSFDIIFIAQSIHHFSPGQVAKMIFQSQRVATTAFVGIDGYRSLSSLLLVPLISALFMDYPFFHDALISARKLYSQNDLEFIAKLAVPASEINVYKAKPCHSVLTVRKK